MTPRKTSAPGKIILSGEYAVTVGYPGIAVPSPLTMEFAFEEDPSVRDVTVRWEGIKGSDAWDVYAGKIVNICGTMTGKKKTGTLTLRNQLPLGRGMGSSTTIVVGVARLFLGSDCRRDALMIEEVMNPGHSGLDFAVIWENHPVIFRKGAETKTADVVTKVPEGSLLIDSGAPGETTPELVAWVQKRLSEEAKLAKALEKIGQCTERLLGGASLFDVFPDHHRAQVTLGVVPEHVQELVQAIEKAGGVAKITGAGGRTGGGGMVLALHEKPQTLAGIIPKKYPVMQA